MGAGVAKKPEGVELNTSRKRWKLLITPGEYDNNEIRRTSLSAGLAAAGVFIPAGKAGRAGYHGI